ncbi:hypothetical protein [Jiangella mangrovi]|uniref:Uncharacterized protein n=1 Tax=Jiangella mangrovi TaxID=1524084 RepID=A0A7W9GUK1_9ACTN|nr:hypothetical protein [Jiangella mangrovi]MBB5790365.1 hypothetical protein [Jiangella mangrovi]
MRVAVCGHRRLDGSVADDVDEALRQHLSTVDRLVGISSLSEGAEQIFAHAVLDTGGRLLVVVPAEGHRDALPPSCRAGYDSLVRRALDVVSLRFDAPTAQARLAAARHMLERADQLVAIWDRQAADVDGGPVDVIREAIWRRIPVKVIWPTG